MADRYICIHGHFYQPPRENPWLEAVEIQDSAYPYHDWNDRITAECYGPNAASRILDEQGYIVRIVNNYSKISFNFGPTLPSWLAEKSPAVYEAILSADKLSQALYSGHGSAIAQVYNHMIMPLANRRDKETQIVWGIRDFEHRFRRMPEGMWLAETAVDTETLDMLAQHGIKFTILATTQARSARRVGGTRWRDVSDGSIDPSTPYRLTLPSGRTMALFSTTVLFPAPSPSKVSLTKANTWLPASRRHFPTRAIGRSSSTSPRTGKLTATIINAAKWRFPMRSNSSKQMESPK